MLLWESDSAFVSVESNAADVTLSICILVRECSLRVARHKINLVFTGSTMLNFIEIELTPPYKYKVKLSTQVKYWHFVRQKKE